MKSRHRPPHLRVVGTDETAGRLAQVRSVAPTVNDIAVAPLLDAGRVMVNDAVEAAVNAAADFGLTSDPEKLRREIRAAVTRYVDGWIVQQLTENVDVSGY